jgi:acetyl-CoA synthetase
MPKGVVHTTGGYMVGAATTFKYVFDHQPGDVFWCTADCGWIPGHTYLAYGPLLNGASQVGDGAAWAVWVEGVCLCP